MGFVQYEQYSLGDPFPLASMEGIPVTGMMKMAGNEACQQWPVAAAQHDMF